VMNLSLLAELNENLYVYHASNCRCHASIVSVLGSPHDVPVVL
jgi:hypothetical protein